MNKLFIKLTKKVYPYDDLEDMLTDPWGAITIELHKGSSKSILLKIEWDILPLLEWFVENQVYIASESFNVLGEKPLPNESLAQAMYRIGVEKFLDPPKDNHKSANEYDGFNRRHSLLTDMEGSNMRNILIGCNQEKGEISLYNEEGDWQYDFDMNTFLADFREEIVQFVSRWLEKMDNSNMQQRGLAILNDIKR